MISRFASLLAAPVALCASLLASAPASAASLQQVASGWQVGTEPSWVQMYWYVPDGLPANAPVLVLMHYCGGNAQGIFGQAQSGGIVTLADQKKILLVVPSLVNRNCWDVATTQALTHNGTNNDMRAVVDQVKYAIAQKNANANRVYVMGASSGAMATQALLAVYPDVFKGGAEFAGVPAGCWSEQYAASNQWSGPCAGGQVLKTPQQWGDLVRAMYPGYTGFRPRIQLWHGSADATINYANYTEAIDQWTNVLGLSLTPATTSTLSIGGKNYNRRQWKDACGITVLDAFDQPNGPHGPDANMNGTYTMPFFNLDQATLTATDPQAAGCGATGTGGAGGGSGGSGGATGAGGSGGATGAGGRGGGTGGSGNPVGSAGSTGSAGSGNPAGSAGSTGSGGSANPAGSGGSTGSGGSGNSAGSAGTTGTAGTGVVTGTGGDGNPTGTAGDTGATGTAGTTGTGGSTNPTGTGGTTGSTGTAGTTGQTGDSSPGWCAVSGTSGSLNAFALAGIVAAAFLFRRRAKRVAPRR
jgi:poly(hydroxyalkanoate) depolymerase family esterase